MKEKCYICDCIYAESCAVPGRPMLQVECAVCGHYQISGLLHTSKPDINDDQRYILSGFIRENSTRDSPVVLSTDNIRNLADGAIVPRTPMDKMDRIMQYLGGMSKEAGAEITIDTEMDYPVAYARSPGEFEFLVNNLMGSGLIGSNGELVNTKYNLTINGWKYLIELSSRARISNVAFVAMRFSKEMDMVWTQGFKPALEKCGYKPVRIDLVHHNEKICDKIIASIRQAGLFVADCTELRPNVFFEAGFACGLGTPVIWTCRSDQIDDLPFDTRQYNHVGWKEGEDLSEKLADRIIATGLSRN